MTPIRFAIQKVAEVSVVGLDQRMLKQQLESLSPSNVLAQRLAPLVMQMPDVPNAPAAKVVGDYGFDPLSLGSGENFAFMREAEIKHARLAMLAAVAWPLQEILHPIMVDALRSFGIDATDVLIESNGASPSLLNGGLGQAEILPALALFTVGCSLLEEGDLNARKKMGLGWNSFVAGRGGFGRTPGNFGFDPLNLYKPLSAAEKVATQERELLNGRVAMLAVAAYVGVEFFGGSTVVRATPGLFEPLIFQPWFRSFMDASFGMASMDGSIEGIAY